MLSTQTQGASQDWTRGAARGFAVVVLLLLVGMGVWIDRANERRAAAWAGVGEPVSIAGLAAGSQGPASSGGDPSAGAISGGLLDLNLATAAQLELLPGIGPASAARIVAYRDQIGGFRGIEELSGVSGIGPRTMERLRPLVRVEAKAEGPGGKSVGSDGR